MRGWDQGFKNRRDSQLCTQDDAGDGPHQFCSHWRSVAMRVLLPTSCPDILGLCFSTHRSPSEGPRGADGADGAKPASSRSGIVTTPHGWRAVPNKIVDEIFQKKGASRTHGCRRGAPVEGPAAAEKGAAAPAG